MGAGQVAHAKGRIARRAPWALASLAAIQCGLCDASSARPLGQPYDLGLGQANPRLAFNAGDGQFLLGSVDFPGRGGFRAIQLAEIAPSGPPQPRTVGRAGIQNTQGQVAIDPVRNRYLVVFTHVPALTLTETVTELFAPDGTVFAATRLGDEFADPARLLYDARHGEFLVEWTVRRDASGAPLAGGPWVQRLDADGRPLGPAVETHGWSPAAYRPRFDDFLALSRESPHTRSPVMARRMSAGGAVSGDPVEVTGGPPAAAPAVAVDPESGRTAVVWPDEQGVRVRTLSGRRLAASPVRTISSPGQLYPQGVAIAFHPVAREWLVAWAGIGPESPVTPDGGRAATIFGQHLSRRGARETGPDDFPISELVGIDPRFPLPQSRPTVAADSNSPRYLAVWEADFTSNSGQIHLYARRIVAETKKGGP